MKEYGSNEEAIYALQSGDSGGFDYLYCKYLGLAKSLIYRHVRNYSEAEDLAEEIFMKLLDKNDKYIENKGKFFNWFYKITKNHAEDFLRRKNRQRNINIHPEDREYKSDKTVDKNFLNFYDHDKGVEPDIYWAMKEKDLEKAMKIAMKSLKPKNRYVVSVGEEMKRKDIAKELRININTVKSRLRRGRSKFAALLLGMNVVEDLEWIKILQEEASKP